MGTVNINFCYIFNTYIIKHGGNNLILDASSWSATVTAVTLFFNNTLLSLHSLIDVLKRLLIAENL